MKIIDNALTDFPNEKLLRKLTGGKRGIFLDIETTGLSREREAVYLIGLLFERNAGWILRQYLAESRREEPDLLRSFLGFLNASPENLLITYNGQRFDLPFLMARCRFHGIPAELPEGMDLYLLLKPWKNLFGLHNLKQKQLETFLGIRREDLLSGKELISIFHEYAADRDPVKEELLLLHNREDVCGMPALLSVFSYLRIFGAGEEDSQEPRISSVSGELCSYEGLEGHLNRELLLSFRTEETVPAEHIFRSGSIFLYLRDRSGTLRIPLVTEELRHYFPDYRNYYYLPESDTAIHRSVGAALAPEEREKARPETAFIRSGGPFLPQPEESFQPVFRRGLREKALFFPFREELLTDSDFLTSYALELLKSFLS